MRDAAATDQPGAVTGLTAASGDGSVTLTWDDPDNSAIDGYQIRQMVTTGDWLVVADVWLLPDNQPHGEDLTNGTSYTFQIRAVNTNTGYCRRRSDQAVRPSLGFGDCDA